MVLFRSSSFRHLFSLWLLRHRLHMHELMRRRFNTIILYVFWEVYNLIIIFFTYVEFVISKYFSHLKAFHILLVYQVLNNYSWGKYYISHHLILAICDVYFDMWSLTFFNSYESTYCSDQFEKNIKWILTFLHRTICRILVLI